MNTSYSVAYSPAAKDDLKNIYLYIAFNLNIPEIAENQVNRIRKVICSLAFMPSKYEVVDWEPWKSMDMHKVPVDNFVVFYAIKTDKHIVTVVRIFYGGRNVENIINAEQG